MLNAAMAELNDTALMLRYRDGDSAAFDALYERHRGPLFRFLVRRTSSQQSAEDLFQEIWSRIIRSRAAYRPTAKFRTYLFRIARNCVVDYYRRNARALPTQSTDAEGAPEPVANTGDPVAEATRHETQISLAGALAELPDEQCEAFLLHEEAGFTLQEIGELTGVGRETVKSRLRYALRKLRQSVPATMEVTQDHE